LVSAEDGQGTSDIPDIRPAVRRVRITKDPYLLPGEEPGDDPASQLAEQHAWPEVIGRSQFGGSDPTLLMRRQSVSPDPSAHAALGGVRREWVALVHGVITWAIAVQIAHRDEHGAGAHRCRQYRCGQRGPVGCPSVVRRTRGVIQSRGTCNEGTQHVWIRGIGLHSLDARILWTVSSARDNTNILTGLGKQ
jgi:hypothetical protein